MIKKILIIAGIIIIVINIFGYFARKWLQDYSVEIDPNLKIPEVSKKLTALKNGKYNWPSWKGSTADNRSGFINIKTDWSGGLNKIWEIKYLCKGKKSITWSCPAIKGNRLVIPGRIENKDYIFCLGPDTGELLWYKSYKAPVKNSAYGEGSRATPTIDENRVYTLSHDGLLYCWNLFNGKKIWYKNLLKLGGKVPQWGYAGSPVVYRDKLIVQVGKDHLLIVFDKNNGKIIWKSESGIASYSTPVIMTINNKDQIILLGGKALYSFDMNTGKKNWETSWKVSNDINICTPVISKENNIIVISSWYNKGIAAIKNRGDSFEVLWKNKTLLAHQADPHIIDNYIYGYSGMSAHNKDDFKCIDLLTGKEIWSIKDFGTGQFIYVKPYFVSLDIKGNLYLIQPKPSEYKLVSSVKNIIDINNARAWTKPVIARQKLYLRYANQLYCYDIKQ